jgi:hypothetical protein
MDGCPILTTIRLGFGALACPLGRIYLNSRRVEKRFGPGNRSFSPVRIRFVLNLI